MCNHIIKSSNAASLDEKRRSHSMRIHIPTIYSIITCQTATARYVVRGQDVDFSRLKGVSQRADRART
jgi:hypothetical protein